jgi:hypothetical protein
VKLYTYRRAPSPRRVALYLAEKKLVLPTVEVDVAAGENQRDARARRRQPRLGSVRLSISRR